MPDWEAYIDNLGLEKPRVSRLMAVARMVASRGLPVSLVQAVGETKLYYAYRALKSGVEVDFDNLPDCQEFRDRLGYKREPMVWVCPSCGQEVIPTCGKCGMVAKRHKRPE